MRRVDWAVITADVPTLNIRHYIKNVLYTAYALPMTEAIVLDVILVVTLIAYLGWGFGNGVSRTGFVIAGTAAGIVGAYFLAPMASSWVPFPGLRPIATILVAIGLIALGQVIGITLGRLARRGVEKGPLSVIDRILGALVAGVVAALVASVVASSIAQLGFPSLTRAVANSGVLRAISFLTPDPVEAWVAQVRGVIIEQGLPIIAGVVPGGLDPLIPEIDTGSDQLNAAALAVVRITGNAYACGTAQSGTGFIVAPNRVVTNAHVVAGVVEPVIEALNGQTVTGKVVYFDFVNDIAVIAVEQLSIEALPLSTTLPVDSAAAVLGYPFGGPFTSGAASVLAISMANVEDIYSDGSSPREIYTLAAEVREGNSGGPLLTLDGSVAGVIFARDAASPTIGYAMTMTGLAPVAAQSAALVDQVSTGECVR